MKLPSHSDYLASGREARSSLCKSLARSLGGMFQFRELDEPDLAPTFVHTRTGIPFKLLLAAKFKMGCSESEEHAARAIQDPPQITFDELRPVHPEEVGPFLMSVTPLLI